MNRRLLDCDSPAGLAAGLAAGLGAGLAVNHREGTRTGDIGKRSVSN